jgi:hypothetical protein
VPLAGIFGGIFMAPLRHLISQAKAQRISAFAGIRLLLQAR